MPSTHFESLLARIEEQFHAVSLALLSGEARGVEQASAALRLASLDLGQFLESSRRVKLAESTRLRIQKIAAGLAAQREGLLRLSAAVDQSLNSLVPATRKVTYAAASSPFGTHARQSGAFKLLSA